jgi:hypothetical protein
MEVAFVVEVMVSLEHTMLSNEVVVIVVCLECSLAHGGGCGVAVAWGVPGCVVRLPFVVGFLLLPFQIFFSFPFALPSFGFHKIWFFIFPKSSK